jgi:hypothetical protein
VELVELVRQDLRIDHHAIADHAQLPRMQHPRRDQVQLPGLAVAHDRVARVVAALEAHDHIGPLGEQVGQLSFAFVAPLGADDHDSRHSWISVRRGRAAADYRLSGRCEHWCGRGSGDGPKAPPENSTFVMVEGW